MDPIEAFRAMAADKSPAKTEQRDLSGPVDFQQLRVLLGKPLTDLAQYLSDVETNLNRDRDPANRISFLPEHAKEISLTDNSKELIVTCAGRNACVILPQKNERGFYQVIPYAGHPMPVNPADYSTHLNGDSTPENALVLAVMKSIYDCLPTNVQAILAKVTEQYDHLGITAPAAEELAPAAS